MNQQKVKFVIRTQAAATKLAQAMEELVALREIWEDRQYKTGLAGQITQEDIIPAEGILQEFSIPALNKFMLAAKDLATWKQEKAATSGSINDLRTDS